MELPLASKARMEEAIPFREFEPTEVVATTEPFALVERRAFARLVMAKEVEVAFVRVTFPVKVFTPLHVLVSPKSVVEAELPELRQVPRMAKQPPARSMPLAKVEVALVPVTLR